MHTKKSSTTIKHVSIVIFIRVSQTVGHASLIHLLKSFWRTMLQREWQLARHTGHIAPPWIAQLFSCACKREHNLTIECFDGLIYDSRHVHDKCVSARGNRNENVTVFWLQRVCRHKTDDRIDLGPTVQRDAPHKVLRLEVMPQCARREINAQFSSLLECECKEPESDCHLSHFVVPTKIRIGLNCTAKT